MHTVKWKHTPTKRSYFYTVFIHIEGIHLCLEGIRCIRMYVYTYVCIRYIGVLVYCLAKVDGHPCVLLNAGLADLPQNNKESLRG